MIIPESLATLTVGRLDAKIPDTSNINNSLINNARIDQAERHIIRLENFIQKHYGIKFAEDELPK
jgi:hypothetical protein